MMCCPFVNCSMAIRFYFFLHGGIVRYACNLSFFLPQFTCSTTFFLYSTHPKSSRQATRRWIFQDPLFYGTRGLIGVSPPFSLSLSLSLHWLIWAVGINRLFKCVTWFLFFPLSSLNIQFPLSKSFSTPLYMYYFFFPFSFVALGAFSFLGFYMPLFFSPNHTFNNWFFLSFFSSSSPPPSLHLRAFFFLSCLKLCRTHIFPPLLSNHHHRTFTTCSTLFRRSISIFFKISQPRRFTVTVNVSPGVESVLDKRYGIRFPAVKLLPCNGFFVSLPRKGLSQRSHCNRRRKCNDLTGVTWSESTQNVLVV